MECSGYSFVPTFGPPERYFKGFEPEDLIPGLAELLRADGPMMERTLAAAGLGPREGLLPGILEFINYGHRQIVFRVTLEGPAGKEISFVAAVGQRPEQVGAVEREFRLLERLGGRHPDLVVPVHAWGYGETPAGLPLAAFTQRYHPLARCIARQRSATRWGIYNPEPTYRFEEFPAGCLDQEGLPLEEACRRLVVATLVATYDEEHGAGIGGSRASGGDFILTRDYRYEDPGALRRCWRLIAARSLVHASREEYLDRIRREFAFPARLESPEVLDGTLLVNHKSTQPFSPETIEAGIQLGETLWQPAEV